MYVLSWIPVVTQRHLPREAGLSYTWGARGGDSQTSNLSDGEILEEYVSYVRVY